MRHVRRDVAVSAKMTQSGMGATRVTEVTGRDAVRFRGVMLTDRTTRKPPVGPARRASAVVALTAAASLGALGAASAHPGSLPAVMETSVPSARPAVTPVVTTTHEATAAPATTMDRADVLALLSRADDYLAQHPDAVGGPVAQAASETGMLLVTYDAQTAAAAALTPPVDLPVSALEPPDPMTTSPWDKVVGGHDTPQDALTPGGHLQAGSASAPTAAPTTTPTGTATSAPASTATPTGSPTGTAAPTTGVLDAANPGDTLPTTGTSGLAGAASGLVAGSVDPGTTGLSDATGSDGSVPGASGADPAPTDVPQANPTSPAGDLGGTDAQGALPDPTQSAAPTATPSPSPSGGTAAAVVPSPAATASVPTAAPTTSVPTTGGDPTPSGVPTSPAGAAGLPTQPAGGGVAGAEPTGATATGTGTPGATTPGATPTSSPTGTSPTASPTVAPGDAATGSADGSATGDDGVLADPDSRDGTVPVTWAEVVAAAERLATALDAVDAAGTATDPTDPAGLGALGATGTTAVTGTLAHQLQVLSQQYGTSVDGYRNGEIPASALCPLSFAPGQMLRCDAANRLEALDKLYEKKFGHPIPMTDSYRPIAVQIELRRTKPALAAVPGTSNHGWGLAVDLGYPISTGASAEYVWMRQHAPAYGWDNPSWAHPDGSKPEPWHFEFYSGGVLPTGTPIAGYTGPTSSVDSEDAPPAPSDGTSGSPSSGPTTVTVPKGLVGQPFATVQKKLRALGLEVAQPTKAYSATVDAGGVLRVTPGPGSTVKAGSTVKVVVSQGPKPAATVVVPDGLVGQPLATVQKKLASLGLTVAKPTKAYSDTVKAGSVVSVAPREGASVQAGSTVRLVVSQGPKPASTVTIPDGLVGQPLATVTAKLKALGLKIGATTKDYSDTVSAGGVISVDPKAGTSVNVGSAVAIVVSLGEEPTERVTIPAGLVGQDPAAVQTTLEGLGLKVVVDATKQPSETIPAGAVLSVDPKSGTSVDVGTTVTVVVSSGPGGSTPTPTPDPTTPAATPTPTDSPTSTPTATEAAREQETD